MLPASKCPFRMQRCCTCISPVVPVLMSRDTLGLNYSVAVTGMDDTVWKAYGAASSPGFVIDRHGRIVLRQVWIDPEEIDRTLEQLLKQS